MTRQMTLPGGAGGLAMRRAPVTQTATPFTIQQFFGIVRRRMWLIIIITSLFTVGGVLLWYALRTYIPEYTSKAMIRCKMPQQENLLGGVAIVQRKEIITMETNNQSFYLRSEIFLNQILTQREVLRNTQWFLKRKDKPDQMMKDMKNAFSASAKRDSEMIMVTMSAGDKEESQLILNEILKQFSQDMDVRAKGNLQSKLSALSVQKDKVEAEILRKRDQLVALSLKVNEPGFEQNRTVKMSEVQMMMKEKILLEAQINEIETQRKRMLEDRQILGYSSMVSNAIQNDSIIMGFKNQISTLQIYLSNISNHLGEDHRSVKSVRDSIDSVQKELQQRQSQLEQQYSEAEERSLENFTQSLRDQFERVSEKFELASTRQGDLDREKANYNSIEQMVTELSRNKEQIDQRINEVRIQLDNQDRVRAEVAMWADKPIEISFPLLLIFGPSGFLLGILFSALLILMLEFFDDSIKIPSDVNRYLDTPQLGMIPFYDGDEDEIEIAKFAHTQPHTIIGEAFRQVRTNLFFSAPVNELKSLLITSSSAECGKTTIAVNLAITLAAEGKRVLLVDANFRRAALNRLFPAEGPPRGLSNVLVGQVSAADVIHSSGYEGLDIVDAGPTPPNPAVLLSSERMQKFMENQKQYYDHIIVDGPPVLLLTDARILSRQVDGTIAVVRAGNTSRGIAQRMVRELKGNQVNLLGILLNCVRPLKGGYFQKAYRSYYDYIGAETSSVATLPSESGKDSFEGKDKVL